jgi:hypothetical protein
MSALPKWTDERTEELVNFVGDETPVTRSTVEEAAERLETSSRSISSKLRKMGYEVERSTEGSVRAFSERQEATLRAFVQDNSGKFTYAEIADAFEGGAYSAKSIQGKILSMELTSHIKPTPKAETVKTYTEAEEARFVKLAADGAFLEDIAEALNREVNSVRGKALSLLRAGTIEAIPGLRDRKVAARTDVLEGLDVPNMTVVEIAEAIQKTPRGVKTMLTRRGLAASDYDGAAKREKAE